MSAPLLEQAKEAVRKSRDFEPANGEHYTAAEVEQLNRLCRDAYLACQAAGVTIGQMRLLLCREERDAHRAQLQAICDEFRTAAFERAGRGR
jgi:hypothetical protein